MSRVDPQREQLQQQRDARRALLVRAANYPGDGWARRRASLRDEVAQLDRALARLDRAAGGSK